MMLHTLSLQKGICQLQRQKGRCFGLQLWQTRLVRPAFGAWRLTTEWRSSARANLTRCLQARSLASLLR